jgi:hypothetical protein
MIFFLDIVSRNLLFPIRVLMVFLQKSLAHLFIDSYPLKYLAPLLGNPVASLKVDSLMVSVRQNICRYNNVVVQLPNYLLVNPGYVN